MSYTLFFDTNALLTLQQNAFKENFVISQKTLQEIEHIKSSARKDGEVKYKARKIGDLLDKQHDKYVVVPYSSEIESILTKKYMEISPDNIILASAYWYNENIDRVIVVSDDINCKFISREIFYLETKGVEELDLSKNIKEYKGFKDVTLSDDEMSYFYRNTDKNIYENYLNEYLIIRKSDGEVVDYRKWNGFEYKTVSYKTVNSSFLGKIKPRNPEQVLAFDMLQDKNTTIKVLSGKFGSGKDYLMIANALKMIEDGKYDKLLYVRNAIGVKDSEDIGFLPGTKDEKLRPYAMPLADHLGGETGLDIKIMAGDIEIEHLGYIRGRDLKNCIVYCSEAENLTKEHVQLLIGRIGDGSSLWINGDFKQTDSHIYRMNNGLVSSIEKLAGHEKFGYVQLQKTERSETAAMADLLD